MSKRTRLGKRLDAIGEELAEHQLVEEVETTLARTTDDALFVVDKPGNKKRSKVQKQQKAPTKGTNANAQSNQELVASATDITKRVSRAKFLQAEEVVENQPSKSQQKLVKKSIAALERRNKTLEAHMKKKEKAELPRDIWSEEEERKESTLSARPKPVKTPVSISMSAELFLTKKRDVPKVVVGLTSGNSYNPSVEAHQEAVAILTSAEEKALAERKVLQDEFNSNLYQRSIADTINDHEKKLLEDNPGTDFDTATASEEASPPSEDEEMTTDGDAEASEAEKLTRKERKKLNRARRKAEMQERENVEKAVEEAEAKVVQRRERREQRIRESEEKEEADFLHKTYAYAPVLPVPLSDELTGSLRTMKPVSSTELILDSMANLVGTGQVHKRTSASGVIVQDADEEGNMEVTVLSQAAQRAYKKIGKPYKMLEFPRRKGFAPAEQGAREEEKKLTILNQ